MNGDKLSNADKIISENMQAICASLSTLIDDLTGEHMAFSIVIFNTEPGSRLNYASNCKRAEVVAAWKELVRGWAAGMPDIPAHKYNS